MGVGVFFGRITVETPKYEVLKQTDVYEIRKYAPQAMATVYRADFDNDQKFQENAFRTLAGYIGVLGSPKNKSRSEQSREKVEMTAPVIMEESEKISMTAPVVTDGNDGDDMKKMSFLLPAKYNVKTAPEPTDKRVKVEEIPERVEAVITFSGNPSNAARHNQRERLGEALESDGVKLDKNKWYVALYNPPFCLPWFKTNSIHIPVTM